MLWRPLKSHCTTHHVWERGRELPKKMFKVISLPLTCSLCSFPFCFNYHSRIECVPKVSPEWNWHNETQHKARTKQEECMKSRHPSCFSFRRYSNSPFVIVLFTRQFFCYWLFLFLCSFGIGTSFDVFFLPTLFKMTFHLGKNIARAL